MAAAASVQQSGNYQVGLLNDNFHFQLEGQTWGRPKEVLKLHLFFQGGLFKEVLFENVVVPQLKIIFNDSSPAAKAAFFKEMNITPEVTNPVVVGVVQKIEKVMRQILNANPQAPQELHAMANQMLMRALYDPQVHLEQILKTQIVDGKPVPPQTVAFVRQSMQTAATHRSNMEKIGKITYQEVDASASEYIAYIRKEAAKPMAAIAPNVAGAAAAAAAIPDASGAMAAPANPNVAGAAVADTADAICSFM